jgi:hypothetical protein
MFERFVERKEVSAKTISRHEESLKWLGKEEPSDSDLRELVIRWKRFPFAENPGATAR